MMELGNKNVDENHFLSMQNIANTFPKSPLIMNSKKVDHSVAIKETNSMLIEQNRELNGNKFLIA
jgi:hypothetical protein